MMKMMKALMEKKEVKMNEDDKMMKIQSFTYLMLINMFCILKRKN